MPGTTLLLRSTPKGGAYIGENGLLPNTPYRLDDTGRFVPATSKD